MRCSDLPYLVKAAPCGRRAATCPMQPHALARGVRPPAGPRAARGCCRDAPRPERGTRHQLPRRAVQFLVANEPVVGVDTKKGVGRTVHPGWPGVAAPPHLT